MPAELPQLIARAPLVALMLAAWWLGGAALARAALGLTRGLEVACLAGATGLLAHVLALNLLARLLPFEAAAWLSLIALLLGGLAWPRLRRLPALDWAGLGLPARVGLALLAAACGLGALALGLREVFPDDGAHAAMAQLVRAGHFPLRFQCNPQLPLGYHYGADLLVAASAATSGLSPWTAVDVVRAAGVAATLQLAFLAGWRERQRPAAGLLSVVLLVGAGQALWLAKPLLAVPAEALPASLGALRERLAWLATQPHGLMSPTNTTVFAQAQRSLAWGFGGLELLLVLALLEARTTRTAKTLAVGLAVGSTALVQVGGLVLLGPALSVAWLLQRLRRGAPAPPLDLCVTAAAVLALALALGAGGPLTDSLLARLQGSTHASTSFAPASLQLPACRGESPSLSCLLQSLLSVGLAPLLLPLLAWRHRGPEAWARLTLVAGALFGAVFPLFVSYPYDDGTVMRTLTFAAWVSAVLLGAPLAQAAARRGWRALLSGATLIVLCLSGYWFLWGYALRIGLTPDKDQRQWLTPQRFGVGPLDQALSALGPRLPHDALVFDPSGCYGGLSSRPAIVFGRYACSAGERGQAPRPAPAFARALAGPSAERLRSEGYTHAYFDAAYWRGLPEETRLALAAGGFERLGFAGDAADFRVLLRVCGPTEACGFDLPRP